MKFRNIEALHSFVVLQNLHECGKLGFVIAKNRRKIENELKEYIEAKNALLVKYGVRSDDDPNQYLIPAENEKEYLKDSAELDDIECDISVVYIDSDAFCSGTLTSDDMYILDWMVKEAEE